MEKYEYSDLTYAICEVFEDFLDERNITIDSLDRQEYVKENGEEFTARIFGDDWDELCAGVEFILMAGIAAIKSEDVVENEDENDGK